MVNDDARLRKLAEQMDNDDQFLNQGLLTTADWERALGEETMPQALPFLEQYQAPPPSPQVAPVAPIREESKLKDVWDAFRLGATQMGHRTKQYFLSVVPNYFFPERTVPKAWPPRAPEEEKRITEFIAEQNREKRELREAFKAKYTEAEKRHLEWLAAHPELQPRPEWAKGTIETIKENPKVLLDPAYIGFVAAESAAFTIAFLGTTVGVTALTKNPFLGLAAGVAVTMPAQTQDLYEDLVVSGATDEQATQLAAPLGMVISSIEIVGAIPLLKVISKPFTDILRRNIQREIAKRTVAQLAKKGLITFTQVEIAEVMEEIAQGAIQDATVKTFDENRDLLENIPETAIRTAIATLPFALVGAGARVGMERGIAPPVEPEVTAENILGQFSPQIRDKVKKIVAVDSLDDISFQFSTGILKLNISDKKTLPSQIAHEMGHIQYRTGEIARDFTKHMAGKVHPSRLEELYAEAVEESFTGLPMEISPKLEGRTFKLSRDIINHAIDFVGAEKFIPVIPKPPAVEPEVPDIKPMPEGTIDLPDVDISRSEAASEVGKEFYDAIPESELDVASTLYLRAADFEAFIKNMPEYKQLSIEEAQELGIALRTTEKAGKLVPAMRKSGFYVTEEFAKYPNFRDINYVSGMWADPTRMMQGIDGGFFNAPLQKYVLHPTRRTVLASLNFSDSQKLQYRRILEQFNMIGHPATRKVVGKVMEHISKAEADFKTAQLLNKPEIKRIISQYSKSIQLRVVETAQATRAFFDSLIDAQNLARKKRRQDIIPYRDNYIPWVAETNIWGRLFGLKRIPADIIQKPQLPDYIKPLQPFNPRAMAREGGMANYEKKKDVQELVFDYIDTATKDIFYTNIIHNAKIHAQTLRSMGHLNSAALIEDWATENYAGVNPGLSRGVRRVVPMGALKPAFWLRRQLTRAVFALNWTWNAFVQTSSITLTVVRYGTLNTIGGLNYIFSPTVRNLVRNNAYSHIIKARLAGKVAMQDLGGQISKNLAIEGGFEDKIDHYLNFLTSTFEEKLTGISVWAAYQDGKRLGFKGRALWEYASEGGAKTQSMYNKEDLPGVLRAREVGALVPFQTFAFEVFNTIREMNIIGVRRVIGKIGTYETISATSIEGKATVKKRGKMLLEWFAVILIINMLVDRAINREPWKTSSFLPFFAVMTGGLNAGNPWNMVLPLKYTVDLKNGIDAIVKYDNWIKLRAWAMKYHLPGGLQLERSLRGLEAVLEGEVRDVRGRTMFEVKPEEWLKAVTMGIYATEEGRAYIDELEKTRGKFYEYTGIPLPERVNIKKELSKAVDSLGKTDDEGNIYTLANYARMVTTLKNKAGINRINKEATPLALDFLGTEELWADYFALPVGDERDEYRLAHPEVEASMFFWGHFTVLRNREESEPIVKGLMQKYGVSIDAIRGRDFLELLPERQRTKGSLTIDDWERALGQ